MAVPQSDGSPPPEAITYAYMFESDKSPTKQFDALLRAIARFIVRLHMRPNSGNEIKWLAANRFDNRSPSLAIQMIIISPPRNSLRFTKPSAVTMTVS
jgi:hypothetical protein